MGPVGFNVDVGGMYDRLGIHVTLCLLMKSELSP